MAVSYARDSMGVGVSEERGSPVTVEGVGAGDGRGVQGVARNRARY